MIWVLEKELTQVAFRILLCWKGSGRLPVPSIQSSLLEGDYHADGDLGPVHHVVEGIVAWQTSGFHWRDRLGWPMASVMTPQRQRFGCCSRRPSLMATLTLTESSGSRMPRLSADVAKSQAPV